jgi:hypothetical protein
MIMELLKIRACDIDLSSKRVVGTLFLAVIFSRAVRNSHTNSIPCTGLYSYDLTDRWLLHAAHHPASATVNDRINLLKSSAQNRMLTVFVHQLHRNPFDQYPWQMQLSKLGGMALYHCIAYVMNQKRANNHLIHCLKCNLNGM